MSQYPAQVLNETERTIKLTWGHPAIYGTPYEESDLPFSNRVFLYIDLNVPDADKDGLITAAADRRIRLEIRDKAYSDYLTAHETPWAFISHDSRDKESFVRELAAKLRSMMRLPNAFWFYHRNSSAIPAGQRRNSTRLWASISRVAVQLSCRSGTMYLKQK